MRRARRHDFDELMLAGLVLALVIGAIALLIVVVYTVATGSTLFVR